MIEIRLQGNIACHDVYEHKRGRRGKSQNIHTEPNSWSSTYRQKDQNIPKNVNFEELI